MAFIQTIVQLPPDNEPVTCLVAFYPGVLIDCLFDSLNQYFVSTVSGLIIPAVFVTEWELIL
jgi:hypothetical protein